MRNRHSDDTEIAIANFALTFAKALLVFCVIMFVVVSMQKQSEEGIRPNMDFMIRLSWAISAESDVDIWIRTPDGNVLYFGNQQAGPLSLERDDLGYFIPSEADSTSVTITESEEVVAVRGIVPGEYIINAHLYRLGEQVTEPIDVTLQIDRINPILQTIFRGTKSFRTEREEIHIVRFRINADGSVSDVREDLPTMIRELR